MAIVKMIIGVASVLLFVVLLFQSCSVGVFELIDIVAGGEDGVNAGYGFFLAFCMFFAGSIGIVSHKSKVSGFISGGIYALGGIMGIFNAGEYFMFPSVLSLIFAAVFISISLFSRNQNKSPEQDKEAS